MKVQINLHYKPWAHGSHIIKKLKYYYIYMLSRSSITIKPTTMIMSCSRTPSQPQRPTPPPILARLTRLNKQGSCKDSSKGFRVK